LAVVVGAGLGAFYFGGLWWMLGRITTSRNPGLLALGSFVARTGLTLAGFYVVAGGQWVRLILCLGGFLLARALLIRRWGPQAHR